MSHLSSPEPVRHYDRGDVLARVLGAVREAGLDPVLLDPDALAACDEFHLGGALATREVSRALRTMMLADEISRRSGLGIFWRPWETSTAKSVLSVLREKYEEFQRRPKSGVALELVSDIDVRVTGRLQALNCHHALCYKSTLYLLS